MAYLTLQAKRANNDRFDIPFDRQELADYLEVDRSGLSAEISKLRNEGVLLSTKNHFELYHITFLYFNFLSINVEQELKINIKNVKIMFLIMLFIYLMGRIVKLLYMNVFIIFIIFYTIRYNL